MNSRPDIVYDPDIQVIEVITKEETFLVINLYNEKEQQETIPSSNPFDNIHSASTSPRHTTFQRTLLNNQAILPTGIPWILAGDMNLNDPLWNSIA